MATDINGWLEVKGYLCWQPVLNLPYFVDCNYFAFGYLFGIQSPENYFPLATIRGLPDDCSHALRAEIQEAGYREVPRASWILWKEIRHLDWSRPVSVPAWRVELHRKVQGELVFDGIVSTPSLLATDDLEDLQELGEYEKGRYVYRLQRYKTTPEVSIKWKELFDLMRSLEEHRKPEQIRLSVYFE